MRIAQRGAGYELTGPTDVALDVFDHVYVLERDRVLIFGQDGKLLATFTPDAASAFRNAQALALDGAGRLYIYDEGQGRVVIFQ